VSGSAYSDPVHTGIRSTYTGRSHCGHQSSQNVARITRRRVSRVMAPPAPREGAGPGGAAARSRKSTGPGSRRTGADLCHLMLDGVNLDRPGVGATGRCSLAGGSASIPRSRRRGLSNRCWVLFACSGVRPRRTSDNSPQPGYPRRQREVHLSAGASLSIARPAERSLGDPWTGPGRRR